MPEKMLEPMLGFKRDFTDDGQRDEWEKKGG